MPDEELYNLDTDPFEIHNLAASAAPEDQAQLEKLRGVLDQWIIDVDDHGRTPEPADTVQRVKSGKAEGKAKGKGKKKAE